MQGGLRQHPGRSPSFLPALGEIGQNEQAVALAWPGGGRFVWIRVALHTLLQRFASLRRLQSRPSVFQRRRDHRQHGCVQHRAASRRCRRAALRRRPGLRARAKSWRASSASACPPDRARPCKLPRPRNAWPNGTSTPKRWKWKLRSSSCWPATPRLIFLCKPRSRSSNRSKRAAQGWCRTKAARSKPSLAATIPGNGSACADSSSVSRIIRLHSASGSELKTSSASAGKMNQAPIRTSD